MLIWNADGLDGFADGPQTMNDSGRRASMMMMEMKANDLKPTEPNPLQSLHNGINKMINQSPLIRPRRKHWLPMLYTFQLANVY